MTGPSAAGAEGSARAKLAELAAGAGLRRIHVLAWRDLADAEAGGSEVHAATIARLWAEAGLDVTMRSSAAPGQPATDERDGYRVVRRAGRYGVFPRAALAEATGLAGRRDGLVEIWNGMPFFTPVWARGPRVTFVHHVHGEMWRMVLPAPAARLGDVIERRVAPPLYRRTRVVTLSPSSQRELVELLGLRPELVSVVPPGVHPRFTPGGRREPDPLVVAVGRVVPVKRFAMLLDALVEVRRRHPRLRAVVAGEGWGEPALRARVADAGAADWFHLAGRVDDDALVDLYRRAWVVAATSSREGWGMTLTEAAACGTPAVATRIPGHVDAVVDGVTGLLADGRADLAAAIDLVLGDARLRQRLAAAALARAVALTWEATALGALEALVDDARRRGRAGRPATLP